MAVEMNSCLEMEEEVSPRTRLVGDLVRATLGANALVPVMAMQRINALLNIFIVNEEWNGVGQ
jgi:hypothetical protein